MKRLLKFATALSVTLLLAAPAMAQIWDETADGGGDAGNFPTGGFQTVTSMTMFNQITGVLDAQDTDAFLITINNATWSAEVTAGTETDTRLWLFDLAGNLLMFNDDSSQTGLALQSLLSDTASFPGGQGLINNPIDPTVGQQVILVINGFADDALDSTLGDNLTDSSTNFDGLHGIDPTSDGVFGGWEGALNAGGTYQIGLTGATFGTFNAIPEPSTLGILALGLVGCALGRRRKK